jgi:hypothetical protein
MQPTSKEASDAVVQATQKFHESIATLAQDITDLRHDKTIALLRLAEELHHSLLTGDGVDGGRLDGLNDVVVCQWKDWLNAMDTIHEGFGTLPPGHRELRQQASEALLQQALAGWGPEIAATLRQALETPPRLDHNSPSIIQDEQPPEDEATDFTMVGSQAWLTIGDVSIRLEQSAGALTLEIYATDGEMDRPLHILHIPAGIGLAHREHSGALDPDTITKAVSTVLSKGFHNSQQGLVAAIVRDAETTTFNDALTICDELMAAAINMKNALLRPDAVPARSTEPEEWDDVCDTCNRSGVSISRTDDDGRTMCSECSDASDISDDDEDHDIIRPTTTTTVSWIGTLWTHVNDELPSDEHTVIVAIPTDKEDGFHYSTASYCLSGKVFIVDGDDDKGTDAASVVAWFRPPPPANHPTPSAQPSTTAAVDREGLKTIHVLTFFPSNGAETSSIGGHDWWPDDASGRQGARDAVMRLMGPIDALADGSSFTMVRLTLPDDVDIRDSEAVTTWVDGNTANLRELPTQPQQ